jgi:hypothetical protein
MGHGSCAACVWLFAKLDWLYQNIQWHILKNILRSMKVLHEEWHIRDIQ